jgi:2-dehydro-3-deoxyglucarate aldolase
MNRLEAIINIRKKLQSGGYSIGSWMQIPHSSIAEIMGEASYDWVVVDMEHGAISAHQLPDLFRALELGNTLPLVRVAQGQEKDQVIGVLKLHHAPYQLPPNHNLPPP